MNDRDTEAFAGIASASAEREKDATASVFLLEVGCDEIPARYLPLAIRDLRAKTESALLAARVPYESALTYGTPRRLALIVSGLAERSRDASTKVRGPAKKAAYDQEGNPTKALLGFAKSLGMDPSAVTVEEVAGSEYVYGERREEGRPVSQVMAEVLPGVVMGLESPYPMRWGEENWRWYRPIRWVVALLGADIVPLSIAGISSGRDTWGHRTLHSGQLEVPSAAEYFSVMEKGSVVVDPEARARIIAGGAKEAVKEMGDGSLPLIDEDLLSEVTSLCEYPAPFLGRFDDIYSSLPKEVLITAMRHHQRYFPVVDQAGNVLAGFIGVRDGDPSHGIDTVRAGNEWVLTARLKDARFFFDQDVKTRLADRLPDLAGVRFLRNSGTMLDKARRMERLAGPLFDALGLWSDPRPADGGSISAGGSTLASNPTLDGSDDENLSVLADGGYSPAHGPSLDRYGDKNSEVLASSLGIDDAEYASERQLAVAAARLAKADLVTSMVREFPELEGIMGGCYGDIEGLPVQVTAAIRDQYLPRGAKDRLPGKGIPSVVALADKLDTLAVAFSLGMEVSGSTDPFALRRHALGVVAILMGYDADLEELIKLSLELAAPVVPNPAPQRAEKMLQFLLGRVEGALLEQGFGVEVIRAVLGGNEKRIARLPKMAAGLSSLVGTSKLGDVVTGWRRTAVLAKSAEAAERVSMDLLVEDPEKALHKALSSAALALQRLYEDGDYAGYLDLLATLRGPIDRCLDEVLINAEDPSIRSNRLALLKAVSEPFTRFADFSHILPLVGREG